MSIDVYLSQKTPLHIKNKIQDEGFLELFEIVKKTYPVDVCIKYIETTSFFPEHVFVKNQHYILWDINYWVLFNWFMEDYNDFVYMRHEGLEKASNHFSRTFMYFLSQIMNDIPSMSFVCALEYYKFCGSSVFAEEDIQSVIHLKQQLDEKGNRISYFSKIFAFHHEMTHVLMKADMDKKRIIQKHTCEFTKLLKSSLSNILSFDNEDSKNDFIKLLDLIIEEKEIKIVEEVQCDFQAFINGLDLLFHIHSDDNKEDLIIEFLESAHISSIFQNYLRSLHTFWRKYYLSMKKSSNKKEFENAFKDVGKEVSYQTQMSHLRNTAIFHLSEIFSMIHHNVRKRPASIGNNDAYVNLLIPTIDRLVDVEYMVKSVNSALNVEQNSKSPNEIRDATKLLFATC